MYLALPDAADEPGKRLVGFDRIELAAGESTRVELVVDSAASNHPFSIWDVDRDTGRTEGPLRGLGRLLVARPPPHRHCS